jgi:predicted phosphoribosyltransferase
MFRDRIDAGLQLARKLKKYEGDPGVVLAVPRGGVPVAYVVAKELALPMELILTKKIGHPSNKEYAIGAASLTDEFVIPHPHASQEYIDEEIERVRKKLKEMQRKFMWGQEPEDLKGKTAIIIDDGIATGNTLLMTARMLKKKSPAKIVVAVPVASHKAIWTLKSEVDEVIAVIVPAEFFGVGAFYKDFEQVDDDEVIYYLQKFKKEMKKAS